YQQRFAPLSQSTYPYTMFAALVHPTPPGLFCPSGDFYIDPRYPVERAVITHAHADHARPGSRYYLCSKASEPLLRLRLGEKASIQGIEFGRTIKQKDVSVSLHPAGHILGSSQIRIQSNHGIAVVTGDYKLDQDKSSEPYEQLTCDLFVTES